MTKPDESAEKYAGVSVIAPRGVTCAEDSRKLVDLLARHFLG